MLREVRGVSTVLPWEDCLLWFGRVRLLAGSFYLREYVYRYRQPRPVIGVPASVLGPDSLRVMLDRLQFNCYFLNFLLTI